MNNSRPELITLQLHEDDRGSVYCAMDNMDLSGIKRTYIVENFENGRVRAWHGHRNADTYLHVIDGAVKVAAMPIEEPILMSHVVSHVVSSRKPQIFKVPAGWYNGAMSLTNGTKLLVYSTLSFDEVKKDDVRLEWHDIVGRGFWSVRNR